MKKIQQIGMVAFFIVTLSVALFSGNIAHAQLDPIDDFIQSIEGKGETKTGLQKFEGRPHELSSVDPGAEIITTVIFNLIDFAKYLLGTIAVIYIILGGIKLITAGKTVDEVSEKQKENLKYILYGLFLSIMADQIIQQAFFGQYGECVSSASTAQACALEGSKMIHGVANFVAFFLGTVAVLIIVLAGFRLVTSGGEEESIKKQKTRIMWAILGLLVVAVGRSVVEGIFFPAAGDQFINVANAKQLIAQVTNFAASFIGTLSVLFFFYGGYLYVASFGNDEQTGKAKKVIVGAVVGILISLAAFGLVRTFISVDPSENIDIETVKTFDLPFGR